MTAVESVLGVVCVHHGCVCVCMMDHRERPQRGQGGQPPPSGVWHPPSFQPPPLHFALCYHSSRSQSFSLTHNREAALSLCLCFPTAWQPEHLGTKVTVGSFWSDFPLRKLDICSTVPQCCHFTLTARQFGLLGSHIRQTKQNTSDVFAQLSSASLL